MGDIEEKIMGFEETFVGSSVGLPCVGLLEGHLFVCRKF